MLSERLERGLAAMGLDLDADRRGALLAYLGLLSKWNKVYNLTAVRDPGEMVARHLLDSLSILPWVGDGTLLDVGSGAGLPAVPLAIAHPGLQVTALDTNSKKTRFITQAKVELGLDQLTVVHARAGEWTAPEGFDRVVSRAFAEVGDFVALAGRYCRPDGRLLAMKAAVTDLEFTGIPPGWTVEEVRELSVPEVSGPRSLVVIAREQGRAELRG
jgi:16S rRNA (guanine527-N7)-methyltransferase